jgi:hypothetical protein
MNRPSSSFYGGPPIYRSGTAGTEQTHRIAQKQYPGGPDWMDAAPEYSRMPPRLRTAELDSTTEGSPIGVAELDEKSPPVVTRGSLGGSRRWPGSKIFELP